MGCSSADADTSATSRSPFASCSGVCSICLEGFRVGDSAAFSSNRTCRHVFHQDCIVSWLVSRQDALCPCCRQVFAVLDTVASPQTSITSQAHTTFFVDTESGISNQEASSSPDAVNAEEGDRVPEYGEDSFAGPLQDECNSDEDYISDAK